MDYIKKGGIVAENPRSFVFNLRTVLLIVAVVLFIIAAIGKVSGWWGAASFAAAFLF
jgi:hypothetical protein